MSRDGTSYRGAERPYVCRGAPGQLERSLGAAGEAGADNVPFPCERGLLGYYASAVAELNLGEAPTALAVVDEYVIQLDI